MNEPNSPTPETVNQASDAEVDSLKKNITKLETDLKNLWNRKLDKENLDLEFLKEKKNNQVRFEKFSSEIEERLQAIEKKLNQMSKTQKPKTPKTGKKPVVEKSQPVTSGGITEEKIAE